jgi:inosine-uridine nucleoside N-ribohydrolase
VTARLIWLAAFCLVSTAAGAKTRVWIDTDPACGLGTMADPDDCFALLHLLASPSIDVVGISTTFGNTSLDAATGLARELTRRLSARVPLFPGATDAAYWWRPGPTAASRAIVEALEGGPLTFVALGPLTNLAATLAARPDLAPRLKRIVAVMGKEPGEIFHPAEGSPDALLGHGPAFSDLNFAKDPRAAKLVFASGVPITLAPYAAGKTQRITRADLAMLTQAGGAAAWVAQRSQGWLRFWRDVVGRDGFYPFDLVAAIVAANPKVATCGIEFVEIKHDDKIGWFGFGPRSLLFTGAEARNALSVTTCRALSVRAVDLLTDTIASVSR